MSCALSPAECPRPREEIQDEFLPAFLGYYRRYRGYGFWAAVERQPGNSWDGFISGRVTVPLPARPNSVTGCDVSLGQGVRR